MYQSFDQVNDPRLGAARLGRLRDELAARGLDGFLVPRADEHQGEYVPPPPSGSTGSPDSPARPASPWC